MMKGPGLFSDIGKKAKDLLTNDYINDQKITISSETATGVAVTSSALKKGGLYALHVGSCFKYKKSIIDVKVDTDSNISSTITFTELLPSTKAITTLTLPDYNSAKVEVQYFHDHGSLASVVGFKQNPIVDLSATVGAHGFAFGAAVGFDTAVGNFNKYSAAIGLTKPDYNVSFILGDKGDTLRVLYVHYLDEKQKSAVGGEISRRFSTNENTVTVGGAYALDELTRVKTRLNNAGKLGALLQHELNPGSVLTISGEFDTKNLDRTPKFGLALALKP
ncbi:mitochondrial outer membrane protein porin 5-like [Dioscorea cayenensis subsp. rotundata]|uniref:Mitochondrial outer membrane protein porin 5-like n=1 Tax=Dioscorea cayennensis subsp. rotundata TaxID=55577 RepID=A0AB40AH30_DIOCR|nr:mitochondrial outer membrane protein porin 5-like [Dioscorea cayenensis subsp. rotundata]